MWRCCVEVVDVFILTLRGRGRGTRTRRNLGVVHQVDTQQVAPEYRADVSVDRIRMKGYRFGTDDILIGYDDPTDVVLCC